MSDTEDRSTADSCDRHPVATPPRRLEELVRTLAGDRVVAQQDVRDLLGDCTRGVDLRRTPTLTGFSSR
jgi:hypothetical protein